MDDAPLVAAARGGSVPVMKLLLDAKVQCDRAGGRLYEGKNPLMAAAAAGQRNALLALLAHGADRMVTDATGMIALDRAKDQPRIAVLLRRPR